MRFADRSPLPFRREAGAVAVLRTFHDTLPDPARRGEAPAATRITR